jgi:hypothetical protein
LSQFKQQRQLMLRCVSRLLGKSKAARAEDEATADMGKKKFVHPYSQHIPQIQKLHIFAESIKSWEETSRGWTENKKVYSFLSSKEIL